jgi:hypothetical protein
MQHPEGILIIARRAQGTLIGSGKAQRMQVFAKFSLEVGFPRVYTRHDDIAL